MEYEGLDFANVENTINEIGRRGEALGERLFAAVKAYGDTSVDVKTAEARCELNFRKTMSEAGVKTTEGYVSAVVNADPEIVGLRKRLGEAEATLAKVRADIDCLRDTRRMFCGWQGMQSDAGL
jgi:hypothetical protein